jgi:hypothetical protein
LASIVSNTADGLTDTPSSDDKEDRHIFLVQRGVWSLRFATHLTFSFLRPWRCYCRRRPQDRDWHACRLICLHYSSCYYLFRNVARFFQSRNRSQEQKQQQQPLSWPRPPLAILIDLLISLTQ